ncbi:MULTISPECIES: protein kinase [unclassified Streptomyces]|uniref:Serine/threonine-protein kinase n=1 Tax=Streptomyces sp. NBC_00119 TaxID=2975659 RepID=A0AAU1U472_9ACTN|nr:MULTISPECIES: serine/threonine-protein kinase [unclassified Streptomyces]MCX4642788.1 serine/threonine-protein kinase [Streptomyces sp. NBC_01446]MCX5323913.1 serine/threonine-protein kinase [Streptomyces sp. NBC_00120]
MPSPLTHDDPVAFGAYRLIARLGSGGMGTVYLARSAGGRTVAVKTMHARIASDPAFRTRFRLEADAARVIGGQFGAAVVDADPFAETPWLATEYVLGPPLDEAIELAGPLPEASVRVLGAALCTALGQLHRSDVVHRDLKPSNIMVTAYGPKVIDFGIARAIGDDRLTSTGAAVGTPAFMSPEQATGQEHTPAGDVFALAGVLVFAATGQGPFGHGQPADLLYRVRYGEPDLTNVPGALAEILRRCLAKDPGLRPTTSELAAQLHDGGGEFAEHLPHDLLAEIGRRATEVWQFAPSRLPAPLGEQLQSATTPPSSGPARRRLLAIGGAAAGLAALGGGAWAWGGWGKRDDDGKPGPDSSGEETKNLDDLWMGTYSSTVDFIPLAPFMVADLTLIPWGNTDAVDPRTGERKWQTRESGATSGMAVDGDKAYQLLSAPWVDHQEGPWPLQIASIDLAKGDVSKPIVRLSDVNGALAGTQVLCAADGVVFVAGGQGKFLYGGFRASQTWALHAIDLGTGKRLWSKPLPSRPDKSTRLHFLTARVVGSHLVALQETNAGKVRAVVRHARTGALTWDRPFDDAVADLVRLPLATDDEHLYLGSGPLQALRLSDGKQQWSSESDRPGKAYGPPSVKDGVLYAVEDQRGLVAVDPRNGKELWGEKGDQGESADLACRPVIGTKYVYYRNGVLLRAIDVASHRVALTYATVAKRFYEHERAKVIVAFGDKQAEAFPLR